MTRGEYARRARNNARFTQKELEKISGVPWYAIHRIESDKGTPKIDHIELLADALGLSIDEYIGHIVIRKEEQK